MKRIILLFSFLFLTLIIFAQPSSIFYWSIASDYMGISLNQLKNKLSKNPDIKINTTDYGINASDYPFFDSYSYFYIDPDKGVTRWVVNIHADSPNEISYELLLEIFTNEYGDPVNVNAEFGIPQPKSSSIAKSVPYIKKVFKKNLPEKISLLSLDKRWGYTIEWICDQ